MLLFIITLFVYLGVIFFDFKPIVQNKNKKEIIIYSILMLISFTLVTLFILDVPIPSIFGLY